MKRQHGYKPGPRNCNRDAADKLEVSPVVPGESDYLIPPAVRASGFLSRPALPSRASISAAPLEVPPFNAGTIFADNRRLVQLAAAPPRVNSQQLSYPMYNSTFHMGNLVEPVAPGFTYPMGQAQNEFGVAGPSFAAASQTNGFGFATAGGSSQGIPLNPDNQAHSTGLYLQPHEWPEMFANQSGLANGTHYDNQTLFTPFFQNDFCNGPNYNPFFQ